MKRFNFKYIIIILTIFIILFIGYIYINKKDNETEYISNSNHSESIDREWSDRRALESGMTYEISFDLDNLKDRKISYTTLEDNEEDIKEEMVIFLKSYFGEEGTNIPDDFEDHIIIEKKE